MSKSKKKELSDLKKIILIQEKIIEKISSERDQVEKLWHHYLDKSTEGWSWYAKYYYAYNNLSKKFNTHLEKYKNCVDTLKQKLADEKGGDHE